MDRAKTPRTETLCCLKLEAENTNPFTDKMNTESKVQSRFMKLQISMLPTSPKSPSLHRRSASPRQKAASSHHHTSYSSA
uniref:Uncharacterized protein n=1 Tax=Arundo donax TaxID=35708 RepID=A0A0A9HP76_ARUDO